MSTKAFSILPSPQPPLPPQNDSLTPPPATFGTTARTYLDNDGNPVVRNMGGATGSPSATPKQTNNYNKEITTGEKFGLSRQAALVMPEHEQETEGENEYWDDLWKTNPGEVWKANPQKATSYWLHERTAATIGHYTPIINSALGINRLAAQHGNQAAVISETKKRAEEASNLVIPNPDEPAMYATALQPGGLSLEPLKVTMGPSIGREVPSELTTGVPESDAAIKQGGGIPGGKMDTLHMFHDPLTGSTLALDADKVTPEAVANTLAESRARYAKADAAKKVAAIPGVIQTKSATETDGARALEALKTKYTVGPVSDRTRTEPSFITPDGKVIYLGQNAHPDAIASVPEGAPFAGSEDARSEFVNQSGSIRVRPNMDRREGETLSFTVPKKGVTPEQVDAIKQSASTIKRGNLIMETAHTPSLSRSNLARPQDWQFKTANDVEKILTDIGAHPSQNPLAKVSEKPKDVEPWMTQAATDAAAGGFSVHPGTGETPTAGKIGSILPEKEVNLGHPATPQDIQKYHNDNKALFEAHPELHIGGYGNELNISAIGPNAEAVAKKLDQHSVYDLDGKKEILTGGQNVQKNFPGYTLEQRLAELKATPSSEAIRQIPGAVEVTPKRVPNPTK